MGGAAAGNPDDEEYWRKAAVFGRHVAAARGRTARDVIHAKGGPPRNRQAQIEDGLVRVSGGDFAGYDRALELDSGTAAVAFFKETQLKPVYTQEEFDDARIADRTLRELGLKVNALRMTDSGEIDVEARISLAALTALARRARSATDPADDDPDDAESGAR